MRPLVPLLTALLALPLGRARAADFCVAPAEALCGAAGAADAGLGADIAAGTDQGADAFLKERCAPAASVSKLPAAAKSLLLADLAFAWPQAVEDGPMKGGQAFLAAAERFAAYRAGVVAWEASFLSDSGAKNAVDAARSLTAKLSLKPAGFQFLLPAEAMAASEKTCLIKLAPASNDQEAAKRVCALNAALELGRACGDGGINVVSRPTGPLFCPAFLSYAARVNRAPATQDPWATFVGVFGHEHGHQVQAVNAGGEKACDKHGGERLADAAAFRFEPELAALKSAFVLRQQLKLENPTKKNLADLALAETKLAELTKLLREKLRAAAADALRPLCGLDRQFEAKASVHELVPSDLSCRRSAADEPASAREMVKARFDSEIYLRGEAYPPTAERFAAFLTGFSARLPKILGSTAGMVPLALCP